MKACINCGNQVEDTLKFCPYCGTSLQAPESSSDSQVTGYENTGYQNQGYENTGYQNQGYDNTGYQNQGYESTGYQNQSYENTGYQNQGYGNTGYQNPGYGNMGYQNQGYENMGYQNQGYPNNYQQNTYQPVKKAKKPINKKAIIIGSIVCGVALICLAVYFIFFAGKLTKSKAEAIMEEYIVTIEDMDVMGLIDKTVPKKVIKDVLKDINREFDIDVEYDDLMDEVEDGVEEIEDYLEDIDIKFSNVKVKKITRFDFKEYLTKVETNLFKAADALGVDESDLDFDLEQEILEISDGEMSIDKVEEIFIDTLEEYGIDIKDVYVVDCSFELELDSYYTGEMEYDSEDIMGNHIIIYKYDGEWYMIPAGVVEGAVLPALIRYTDKSAMSNDISSAKTIKTAVETALGNETIYELLTYGEDEYCYIYVQPGQPTDSGDSPIAIKGARTGDVNGYSSEKAMEMAIEEIGENIGEKTPSIKYTENAGNPNSNDVPTEYVVVVTSKGTVYVYVSVSDPGTMTVEEDDYMGTDAGDDGFQLCPNLCDEYY